MRRPRRSRSRRGTANSVRHASRTTLGDRPARPTRRLRLERLEFRRLVDAPRGSAGPTTSSTALARETAGRHPQLRKRVLIHRGHRAEREQRQDQARRTAELRERREEGAPSLRCVVRWPSAPRRPTSPPIAMPCATRSKHEQHGRPHAGACIGRQEADADGADAHDRQRRHECFLAADAVAQVARTPARRTAARRSRPQRCRTKASVAKKTDSLPGKNSLPNISGGRRGVDIKVVPLDRGADKSRGCGRAVGCRLAAWSSDS